MSRKEKKRKGMGKKVLGVIVIAVATIFMAAIFTAGEAPDIEIIRPKAGDCWWDIHNITWNSTGVEEVKIEYSDDNGTSWVTIDTGVDSSGPDSKTYPWNTTLFNDSCEAKIRISGMGWGYGYLGDSEGYGYGYVVEINDTSDTFIVDNMGSKQTLEFGEPKIENIWGDWPGVGTNTPIWINATNRCIHKGNITGAKNLTYTEYWGPIGGPIQEIETVTVEDNDANDENPTWGNISVVIYKEESCWHELDYYCYDRCGRRAPATGETGVDFIVDADKPTTNWSYIGPIFYDYGTYPWMGNCTTKYICANDTGCIEGGTGVAKIDWSIDIDENLDGNWTTKESGTVYDNDDNDSDPTNGTICMNISIHQDCKHRILHQATDNAGNVEGEWKQVRYVDATPPESNLSYEGCYNITDNYVGIRSEQNVTINVNNTGTEPCIYPYNITTYWRVYFNDSGTWGWHPKDTSDTYCGNHNYSEWKGVLWYNYTKPIKFHDECNHTLVYFSKDPLCNTEVNRTQVFHVDDTYPRIKKEYPSDCGYYNDTDAGKFYIRPCAPIKVNATDGPGECASGIEFIAYRIWFDGMWHPAGDHCPGYPPDDPYCGNYNYTWKDDMWWYTYWSESVQREGICFHENCTHYLNVTTKDKACHQVYDNQTYYVDDEWPTIEKNITGHGYWIDESQCGAPKQYIRPCHPIYVNATDPGNCSSSIEFIAYRIWFDGMWHPQNTSDPYCGNDNYTRKDDMWWYTYKNDTVDRPWICFHEECKHYLNITAKDRVCHQTYDNETFYVDDGYPSVSVTPEAGHGYWVIETAGGIIKEYIRPCHPIRVTAEDTGTCASGIEFIAYRIWFNDTWHPIDVNDPYCGNHNYTWKDDMWWYTYQNDTVQREKICFHEKCVHILNVTAKDMVCHQNYTERTFYVDDDYPEIIKTPEPTHGYYKVPGTEIQYIKPCHPIYVNATDPGNCSSGIEFIAYRIWFDGMWHPEYYGDEYCGNDNYVWKDEMYWYVYKNDTIQRPWICFHENCTHYLNITAKDRVCHQSYDNQTFYVDGAAPTITKTHPEGNVGIKKDYPWDIWWACEHVTINLTATDKPVEPCKSGIESIFRRWEYDSNGDGIVDEKHPEEGEAGAINGSELESKYGYTDPNITGNWWYQVNETTFEFTFDESCNHTLYYFAKDMVCNRENIHKQSYHIDNDTPITNKTFNGCVFYIPDDWPGKSVLPGYSEYVTIHNTWINLTAEDQGICTSGINRTRYKIKLLVNATYNESSGQIEGGEWTTIQDWTNYTGPFSLTEECLHWIKFYSVDNCSNIEPIQMNKIAVDETPPESWKEFIGPYWRSGGIDWVTSETMICINATDYGCLYPAGVCNIKYRIVIYETDPFINYTGCFNLSEYEEGEYEIEHYAKDCICNTEEVKENNVWVDDTPPTLEKTVGDPNESTYGGYYVTTDTEITLSASDSGVGLDKLEYKINDGDWTEYTGPFTFGEKCIHNLSVRAVDRLEHTTYDNETFYVDDSPPVTEKDVDGKWVMVNETNITLSATDKPDGCAVGVKELHYNITYPNGTSKDFVVYGDTVTFNFTQTGIHTLRYYAVDDFGHIETETTQEHNVTDGPVVILRTGQGYPAIQDAIDNATDGDTILVYNCTYNEDLVIDVADLTIKSASGKDNTIIQLQSGVGIDIRSGGSGFTLGGAAGEGFNIKAGATTTFNIQLTNGPSGVEISYNIINTTGSASMGISVGAAGASDLTISNNEFIADSGDGAIWGPNVVDVTVSDNTFDPGAYAIQFSGVTGTISGNSIEGYSGSGGIVISNGAGVSGLTITNNTITGCSNGIYFVEYCAQGTPGDMTTVNVTQNTLTDNNIGIRIGDGAHVKASQFTIENNNMDGSTTWGIQNQHSSEQVTAECNWWGDASGPGGEGPGTGDNVSVNVDYYPWLDAPYPVGNCTGIEYMLHIDAGWNMISLPVVPADNSVSAIFDPTLGAHGYVIYAYDPVGKCYIIPMHIEKGRGYWFMAYAGATDIPICGGYIYTYTRDLTHGWNMIGSPINETSLTNSSTVPVGSVLNFVYGWNGAGYTPPISDFEPGQGYWILATQDCEFRLWILPPPP